MTKSPKYKQCVGLQRRIDWRNVMKMERYSGGHDEQMKGLLKDVTVMGHYNEGDYQGIVATCVMLNDTKEFVIYNDYYGSCSGCDAWEGATDEDVRKMCIDLANGAYIFKNIKDCIEFLTHGDRDNAPFNNWEDCREDLFIAMTLQAEEDAKK